MTTKPEQDFYAPWSTQPDPVQPMTREQAQEFGRRARELMERDGLIKPRDTDKS